MTLGDQIAVMKDGVIQQYAPPQETYDHPTNQFVAGFIGSPGMNFLPADARAEGGQIILAGEGFDIRIPESRSRSSVPARVIVGVRPEDLDGPVAETSNTLSLMVSVKEQLGHSLLVYGSIAGSQVVASLDPHRQVELDATIRLSVNLDTVHVFDPESLTTLI